MFLQKAALRPIPEYAVIDIRAISALEDTLDGPEGSLQRLLDTGYRELDRQQPLLASYLVSEMTVNEDEFIQSVGYFLCVAVFLAFREAFPTRLSSVDDNGLRAAMDTLTADEELRAGDPGEVLDSDDVVAMGQPLLLDFVQKHVRDAVEQAGDDANFEDLDRVYRAVLIEVIALSHAVESPSGEDDPYGEIRA